jgi:hypothetical protein
MALIEKDPPAPLPRLALNSLVNTRKSYARLIRAYTRGTVPEAQFKAVCYGLGGLCAYWKEEKAVELEKRIEAIEKSIRTAQ